MASTKPSRKIIVFGSTGVGKSSLISSLVGRPELPVSNGALGTTFATTSVFHSVDNIKYEFIDTCGLNETDVGSVPTKAAIKQLVNLIKISGSNLHLLIYVMHYRVTTTTYANYKLFVETITKSRVPLIIMVNGCEKTNPPSDWAKQPSNTQPIRATGIPENVPMVSTCFAASDDVELDQIYAKKRQHSANLLWTIIPSYKEPITAYQEGDTTFDVLRETWNYMCDTLGWPSFLKVVNKALHSLLVTLGLSHDEAIGLAKESPMPRYHDE